MVFEPLTADTCYIGTPCIAIVISTRLNNVASVSVPNVCIQYFSSVWARRIYDKAYVHLMYEYVSGWPLQLPSIV